MSLSGLEEKVYFALSEAGVVSFETVKSWKICSGGTLKVVMHRLVKKGYILRIKKGLYAAKKAEGDALLAAQSLYNGYLAFSAALYVHRLSEELPFTIFVATRGVSKERNYGNYSVKAVAFGKRFMGAEKKEGVSVSTIPKTVYDCFHTPQYAGGYASVLKAVHNAGMDAEQWEEFLYYVKKFESHAFCQRVGYMLGILKKTKTFVPDFVLDYLKSRIKYEVCLGKGKGVYIKHWKIHDSIGEKKLLSWWYHG